MREGDFLETVDELYFEVRGHIHPPGFSVAFLRYAPYRVYGYGKERVGFVKIYDLGARSKFLEERYPRYLRFDVVFNRVMQEVPNSLVKHTFDPKARLEEITESEDRDGLEVKCLQMAELIAEKADIDKGSIGITGSLLLKLHREDSDLDLVIYGILNSLKVEEALRELLTEGGKLNRYGREGLLKLYRSRGFDGVIGFDEFAHIEERKTLQGLFTGTDYFIRFVRDPFEVEESYGDPIYEPIGEGGFNALVLDDSEALFTPCRYRVEGVAETCEGDFDLTEAASFRGRFCGQARKGEEVEGRGIVEKVTWKRREPYYRVVLGEGRGHFLIPVGDAR